MRRREWALVAFTLLMQLSVGALVVSVALSFSQDTESASRTLSVPLAIAAAAGMLALVVSLLHLGRPAQAWLALANPRTSWLSREVAASMLFVAYAVVLVLQRRPVHGASAAIGGVFGLFVVYAMSRLYMVPAQPAWNRLLTPLTFLAGTLLLGAAVVMTASAADPLAARWLAFVAMGLIVLQIVLTPMYLTGLSREPVAAISAGSRGSTAAWLATARIGAAIAAVFLLAAAPAGPTAIAFGVLAFVLVTEIAGRVLFYAGAASLRPL